MKLVTYLHGEISRPGVLIEEQDSILDINSVLPEIDSINALIEHGESAIGELKKHIALSASGQASAAMIPTASLRFLAPIPQPVRNIFCVGKNYYEHAKEFHDSGYDASAGKQAIPEHPIYFTKSITTVIGPLAPIVASDDWTQSVDYEAELAVVIGKTGRAIKKADANAYIFGYTIINDVTSRTLQQQHKQWFLGKNFDSFCPMGPVLMSADEVGNIDELTLSTHVNGELRQSAKVSDLIFDVPTLIESLSAVMTLLPGDIIATGTPAGVGLGFNPPKFLRPGDSVKVAISKLGELENPVK